VSSSFARSDIRDEQDVVHGRRRVRLIAEMLGFDRQAQIRIGADFSEVARTAQQHGREGEAEFSVEGSSPTRRFTITVRDHGAGTIATLGEFLPPTAPPVTPTLLRHITDALVEMPTDSTLEEDRAQDEELLTVLELLRQRDEEVTRITRELMETNTGVVALYAELERNSERLRESEQMLLARNNALKDFSNTIAHDLKAPLRGISGYAEELESKHSGGLSERAAFCLSQIQTASRNMDRLIDDLLYFARVDAAAPAFAEVNLQSLVAAILNDRGLVIAELHADVTVDIGFATLWTWESGLIQVLSNLIDNALKYSRKATPPRVGIRAEESDDSWLLVVSDNGIGFDMKYHDRMYGLFNRLVRAEDFEGTGVGLAIVKKVLDKLGGNIRAESQPGNGAIFYAEVPKSRTGSEELSS
jgi:signal transduction histidine kinase